MCYKKERTNIMKKLLLILLCLPMIGYGQNFIKEYNQNEVGIGSSVIQTSDNGYLLASTIIQFINDSLEFGLYKIDVDGNLQWDRISGGIYNNFSSGTESILQLTDGKFISLSLESPNIQSPLSKIRLIKRDINGNGLWEKNYDADSCAIMPMNLAETNDGGYIIYASVNCELINTGNQPQNGDGNSYLIKTDNMGIITWSKIYNSDQLFRPLYGNGFGSVAPVEPKLDVEQTTDGGFILSGTIYVIDSLWNFRLEPGIAKLNPQGDIDWIKSYDILNSFSSIPHSVEQTNDGGYILSGNTFGLFSATYEGFVIKTDNGGNLMWNILDSTGSIIDVKQTNDGGYIYVQNQILIDTISNFYNSEIVLNKIDGLGNNLWNKSFSNYSANSNIEQTNDGGYVLCGTSIDSASYERNILLIKTDGNGDITSTFNIPMNSKKGELLKVTDLLGRETKQTNQPLFYIYDDGTIERRIVIE